MFISTGWICIDFNLKKRALPRYGRQSPFSVKRREVGGLSSVSEKLCDGTGLRMGEDQNQRHDQSVNTK